jgi:hypothetical protein
LRAARRDAASAAVAHLTRKVPGAAAEAEAEAEAEAGVETPVKMTPLSPLCV